MTDADDAEPTTWLVDGFNVLHAAVLRGPDRREWWRAAARERVVALARGFDDPRARVVVVFDGPRPPEPGRSASSEATDPADPSRSAAGEPADPATPREEATAAGGRLEVVFAASADEWMVRAVRQAAEPARMAVVTADRQLADRARHRGARVVGPWAFVRRCVGGPAAAGSTASSPAPSGGGLARDRGASKDQPEP